MANSYRWFMCTVMPPTNIANPSKPIGSPTGSMSHRHAEAETKHHEHESGDNESRMFEKADEEAADRPERGNVCHDALHDRITV